MHEESRILREHIADLEAALDRLDDSPGPSSPSKTVKTTTVAAYPTAAGKFYGVQEQAVAGAEAEGATPTYTAVGPVFYAVVTGSVPPPNSTLVVHLIDGRWQGQY